MPVDLYTEFSKTTVSFIYPFVPVIVCYVTIKGLFGTKYYSHAAEYKHLKCTVPVVQELVIFIVMSVIYYTLYHAH